MKKYGTTQLDSTFKFFSNLNDLMIPYIVRKQDIYDKTLDYIKKKGKT